jgi:hypothetical protein
MADVTRIISHEQHLEQLEGATPIASGIWLDRAGDVHFSIPELLELFEIADTPANQEICREIVEAVIRNHDPRIPIVRQELEP